MHVLSLRTDVIRSMKIFSSVRQESDGGSHLVGLRLEEGHRGDTGEARSKVSILQEGGDDVEVEIEGRMDRTGHRVNTPPEPPFIPSARA